MTISSSLLLMLFDRDEVVEEAPVSPRMGMAVDDDDDDDIDNGVAEFFCRMASMASRVRRRRAAEDNGIAIGKFFSCTNLASMLFTLAPVSRTNVNTLSLSILSLSLLERPGNLSCKQGYGPTYFRGATTPSMMGGGGGEGGACVVGIDDAILVVDGRIDVVDGRIDGKYVLCNLRR
jgi:hypothetical protein